MTNGTQIVELVVEPFIFATVESTCSPAAALIGEQLGNHGSQWRW